MYVILAKLVHFADKMPLPSQQNAACICGGAHFFSKFAIVDTTICITVMIEKIIVALIVAAALAYFVWHFAKVATSKEVDCGCGRGKNCPSRKKPRRH